jgi:hypothetical protein
MSDNSVILAGNLTDARNSASPQRHSGGHHPAGGDPTAGGGRLEGRGALVLPDQCLA